MVLTDEERKKFAKWLHEDSASNRILAAQMEHIGPSLNALALRKFTLATAEELVADELDRYETQIID